MFEVRIENYKQLIRDWVGRAQRAAFRYILFHGKGLVTYDRYIKPSKQPMMLPPNAEFGLWACWQENDGNVYEKISDILTDGFVVEDESESEDESEDESDEEEVEREVVFATDDEIEQIRDRVHQEFQNRGS